MATDARISTGLPTHPKTKKLVRRLGGDAGWRLVCLFLWAAAHRSDGILSNMSDEDIELAAEWHGQAGSFVTALVDVGFIKGAERSRTLTDWGYGCRHALVWPDSEARSK